MSENEKLNETQTASPSEAESVFKTLPLRERIKKLQDAVKEMGPDDPNFDMKKFTDELSGDI